MEPKIGDKMKVSPQLTAQADWIDGEVIDVEHNPFMGLVISIKDKLGRIFFVQSLFFIALLLCLQLPSIWTLRISVVHTGNPIIMPIMRLRSSFVITASIMPREVSTLQTRMIWQISLLLFRR